MKLFKHNQEIFDKYKVMRLTHKNIIIIHGTGLGKTSIAAKIIESYFKSKPVLYVVPRDILKQEVEKHNYWNFPLVEFICYHSLKKYNPEDYSLCIFDEVHRAGAPTWINEAKRFVECKSCNVLGLTATEIRTDGINVSKHLFNENDIIRGLDIGQAIEKGLLLKPTYVSVYLEPENIIDSIELKLKENNINNYMDSVRKNIILDKLNYIKKSMNNQLKIENIINKHTNGSKKFIIIVQNIKDCKLWRNRFKEILNTKKVYEIHSKNDKEYNRDRIEYFNNYNGDENIAIIGVNMLTEGLHINGASQIIMLRNTRSFPLYTQMVGRVLECTNNKIHPVIYDLTENYKTRPAEELLLSTLTDIMLNRKIISNPKKRDHFMKIIQYFNIISDYIKDFDELINIAKAGGIIWTDEMIEDVMNPNLTSLAISKNYNISSTTVDKKRNELNICTSYNGFSKVIWTDEMIEDVMNPNLSGAFIAKKYNLHVGSVSRKRNKLNIKYIGNKIIWTDEIIKDIMNLELSSIEISRKYNINSTSILNKRKELGIISGEKIMANRDNLMKDIMNPELTGRYLVKKYHISDTFISQKRKELGIATKYCKVIWTDEMIEDLMNPELSNISISRKYMIPQGSVSKKRSKLGVTGMIDGKIIWTDEMIKDLMNPELRDTSIGKKYSINRTSVSKKREELGVINNYKKQKFNRDGIMEDIMNPNLSNKYISKTYHVSNITVSRMRNDYGIQPISMSKKVIWTDEMIEDLMNPELSHMDIAIKHNIDNGSVARKRSRLGVKINLRNPNTIIWTDEMIEDIMNPNLSGVFIAKKYGIGKSSVHSKRNSLGVISNFSNNYTKTVEGN